MENYQQDIVKNIKREPESEDLDQFTCEDSIVGNIKHEPERHFVFIMPDDPEPEVEVKEVKIVLKKFDKRLKNPAKFFESYFVCDNCNYTTRQSHHLSRHLKNCKITQKCDECGWKSKSEIIKECGFCDLKFDCDNCKKNHQNQDHLKGFNWHCTKCDYKSSKEGNLIRHYLTHAKNFSCETCKQSFSRNEQLKIHQQNRRHGVCATEPVTKLGCRICDRSFATKCGLYHHERSFHSKTKFHCDICGKITKTKNHLQKHMNTHLKDPCPICQHLIARNCFKEHIENHSASEKFECDDCEKVYSSKKKLKLHKIQKHEIDEVQCDLCTKIFKNKVLLRGHMNYHLKVSCKICHISTSKRNLKKHTCMKNSHPSELLFCNIVHCQQKFQNIEELKEHKEIHIGSQKYKCSKCNQQMTTLQNIKLHMKRMHQN